MKTVLLTMQALERLLRSPQLPFGLHPSFIAERQAGHLIGEFQLQLLATFGKSTAEPQQMLLNQTGGCGDSHGALAGTDESLAQAFGRAGLDLEADPKC